MAAFSVGGFVAADPMTSPGGVEGLRPLLAALDLDSERTKLLRLASGAALLHTPADGTAAPTLRWIRLPHRPTLDAATGPVDGVFVLAAPLSQAEPALRIVASLRALLRRPAVLAGVCDATTREALMRALAPLPAIDQEIPVAGDEALTLLGSSPSGLPAGEVIRRRAVAGENRLERVRHRAPILRLLAQFWSLFAVLLWVGGALAYLAGMPQLGLAIFAVIVINGAFSFLQESRAERAIEALARLLPRTIVAVREGVEVRVRVEELVPGDVVRVEEGDQVPADGHLIAAEGMRVDQSPLTGESAPVFKMPATGERRGGLPPEERPESVFAGTAVMAGSGTFVVTATGMATGIGRIARLTQGVQEEPSPLQRELRLVARVVTVLALFLGSTFFVLGIMTGALAPREGFLFALGVIVANVPEGLLPTMTLALALGAQRMARHRSLVRRLSAVETLGATTVICTDKTGTLTENRMAARFVWVAGATHAAEGLTRESAPGVPDLFEAAVLASHASLDRGDPSEVALLRAGAALGVDAEAARRTHRLLAPHPFDSFRKRMTNVCAAATGPVAYSKGAPQEMLALCTTVRMHGATVVLDDALRRAVLVEHDRLAADGLRILAVAVRPLPPSIAQASSAEVECELTLLGMVALWDPPLPDVPDAVALCRRAGIRVVMATGDHGLTARAIATSIGLPLGRVVTGAEIDGSGHGTLGDLVAEPGVLFARVSPAHKLAIVMALRARGEVVAVTGDGVNDAPALKAADIGVAMGQRGSQVAKEAAAMVITDDNFASIVGSIRLGRSIYANMGKFVTYIFASNVPELVPFLAFILLGIPLPLTVMQILAVDLGTDLLPALALGAEPPEPGIMDRPPRRRSQRLLGAGRLLRAYAFLGLAEAALAMLAFFWTYWLVGWRPGMPLAAEGDLYRRATTMTLAAIVAAQVGNVFACRTDHESAFRRGLFRNRLVQLGVAAEIAILLALIMVPPLARIFGLAPLSFHEWGLLLLFPPAILALEEMRKWLARRRRPAHGAEPRASVQPSASLAR